MTRNSRLGWLAGGAIALSSVVLAPAGHGAPIEEVSYKLDVYPILESRCVSCHKPGAVGLEKSGLDLSGYDGLMKGTRHGAVVVAGDPLTSNLNVLVEGRAAANLRMPHDQRPLLKYQTLILRDWVKQGARNN